MRSARPSTLHPSIDPPELRPCPPGNGWSRRLVAARQRRADRPQARRRRPPVEDVAPPRAAASRVSAVTVYQGSALVTREVAVPAGQGDRRAGRHAAAGPGDRQFALHRGVGRAPGPQHPVPDPGRPRGHPQGGPGQGGGDQDPRRRGRADQEGDGGPQPEPRFLQKLENFTGATMQGVAEKGMLNGETTIRLTTFVMESRAEKSPSHGRPGAEAQGQRRGRPPSPAGSSRSFRPGRAGPRATPWSWSTRPTPRRAPSG